MKENPNNIVFVCDTHAPKSGKYKDEPLSNFVGKFVKVGFPCKHPKTGKMSTEHMWLNIYAIASDTKGLLGELDNDPVMDYSDVEIYEGEIPECGNTFYITADEIEDVLIEVET